MQIISLVWQQQTQVRISIQIPYHILQRELLAARHQIAIHRYRWTAIEEHALTITSTQIAIQIGATSFEAGTFYQIGDYVGLAQLHVTARWVDNYLHAR